MPARGEMMVFQKGEKRSKPTNFYIKQIDDDLVRITVRMEQPDVTPEQFLKFQKQKMELYEKRVAEKERRRNLPGIIKHREYQRQRKARQVAENIDMPENVEKFNKL